METTPIRPSGYDEEGIIEFVTFEHLTIKGLHIADDMQKPKWYLTSDTIPMYVNEHVTKLTFTCLWFTGAR